MGEMQNYYKALRVNFKHSSFYAKLTTVEFYSTDEVSRCSLI